MDKKFCIECGALLNGTATFCTVCGRRQPNFVPRPAARPVNKAVSESAANVVPEAEPVIEATEKAIFEPEAKPVTETAAEAISEPEPVTEAVEAARVSIAAETAEEPAVDRNQPIYQNPQPVQVQEIAVSEQGGGIHPGYIALIAGAMLVVAMLMWTVFAMNKLIVTDVSESRSVSVHVPPEPDTPPVTLEPQDDYSGVGGFLPDSAEEL